MKGWSRTVRAIGALALVGALVGMATMANVGAATLTTKLAFGATATLSSVTSLGTAQFPANIAATIDIASGTGTNQADVLWTSAARSLASNITEDIDIKGSLTDAFGAAFTPAKLKYVYIRSSASNTTDLTLLGDVNSVPILGTAATTTVLQPGGVFCIANYKTGFTVTAGTGDIIQVANAVGATATYDIVLIGTST